MYGGDLKTDAHDAFIIAEVSANLPRLVKPVCEKSDACLRLATLMAYDRELTLEATRVSNRLHDLLLSACPALEMHLQGRRLQSVFSLALLKRYGSPTGLKSAGRGNVRRWVRSRRGMGAAAPRKVDGLFEAIGEQSVEIRRSVDIEELM